MTSQDDVIKLLPVPFPHKGYYCPRYAYASRGKIGRHFIKVMNEYRVARCSMAHSVYFSHTWCLRLCSSLTQIDDSISSRVNTFFVEVFSEVVEQTTISTELVVFSVFGPAALPSQIALLSVQFNSKCNASPGIFSAYVRPTYRRVHKKLKTLHVVRDYCQILTERQKIVAEKL